MKKMKKRMLLAGLLTAALLLISCGAGAVPEYSDVAAGSDDEQVLEASSDASDDASIGTDGSEDPSSIVSGVEESPAADESSVTDESVPVDESGDDSEPEESAESTGTADPEETSSAVENSEPDETSKQQPANTGTGSSHKHSYKETVVAPTCEEKGYTLHKCSCGESYTDKETDALGHDYTVVDKWIYPTETTRGKTIYKCYNGCDGIETVEYYSYNEYANMLVPYVLDALNEYRAKEGVDPVKLSKKATEYDQYRAKQLTTNFSHSFDDACAAAEATHVGHYWAAYTDPETGVFYPERWAGDGYGEVIQMGYIASEQTVESASALKEDLEHTARTIVEMFWQSPPHKAILAEKTDFTIYVGIGVYDGRVCIGLSSRNQDDTGYDYNWYDESTGRWFTKYVKE